MMLLFVHRLLSLVTALAFLGGATLQAMPMADIQEMQPRAGAMQVDLPCDQMTAMAQASKPAGDPLPCKGLTLDCIKQMGCVGVPSLLPSADVLATSVVYAAIIYWPARPQLDGVSREPDLFPPIAL
jgi:hypothetical protein